MGLGNNGTKEEKSGLLTSTANRQQAVNNNLEGRFRLKDRATALLSGMRASVWSARASETNPQTSEYERLHGVPEPTNRH